MIQKQLQRIRDALDTLEIELPETHEVIDACEAIRDGVERLDLVASRKDTDE